MKFKVLTNQKWLLWAQGMVIYPFVIIRPRVCSETLFRHELEHCYQIQREGVIKFYLSYVWKLIRHTGYKNHPDEVEAYQAQNKKLTKVERQWYESGVIELND